MSMRKAINGKCRECIYDPQGGGTWRAQVEACTSPGCALYAYRPVSTKRGQESAELAPNETEDEEVEA
jgi:hypothetical protein